jgi:hypothetical protein
LEHQKFIFLCRGQYLSRYRSGDHEAVWAELLALGPAIRDEPLYSEALAVAHETMSRARRNVATLIERLTAMGYHFGRYPDGSSPAFYSGPLSPPDPGIKAQIDRLEAGIGSIPLSLRVWWEVVGTVDFIGQHPDWPELSDPLVVYPPEAAEYEFDEWKAWREEVGPEEAGPFYAPLAPDDLHKDNISGGGPYAILLPNPAIDARLEDEWHNTTFVNYLRICFRWGGFPGFERVRGELPNLWTGLSQGLLPI